MAWDLAFFIAGEWPPGVVVEVVEVVEEEEEGQRFLVVVVLGCDIESEIHSSL